MAPLIFLLMAPLDLPPAGPVRLAGGGPLPLGRPRHQESLRLATDQVPSIYRTENMMHKDYAAKI